MADQKPTIDWHTPPPEPALPPLPEKIGRYSIEERLGKGGFGVVYLAYDDQLERKVAVKVPHAKLISKPEYAEMYLAEARTVANLDHPNIVPVFDVGGDDECPCFIVSKYIDGMNVSQRIKENRPSVGDSAELVATVAEALHYAHKQGLVHRDVKPGNILLDKDDKPYVADFGLALKEEDVGKGPRYAGTPAYMSPEQARGEGHRVDGRSDIFSLGVVFYELLVGRKPFRADTKEELLEQITGLEVRPPRQWDDAVPKELERICLKALSKRASERYTTAKDMADDLTHFLADASGEEKSTITHPVGEEAEVATPIASITPTPSDSQPVKIVPKGLRSFDEHDADFFLELLPGPRDREGLPDSIRFWKTRIEENDPDKTFSVGLIYGPSGCGKSSLVKAGLLPRLSEVVNAVYVESTGEETESRLLNGLRKHCPALEDHLNLKDTLAALRRGQGIPISKKVLIVLDQFEQWLHAKKEDENTDLVQALRQCDGGKVQCIVMVRDDFWLAVSRFMRHLEVRLLEGQNSALVDLFDLDHASKVLAAFGRAFGKLPENAKGTTKEQTDFLRQSVGGLAEEGKVICVRLALIAEMLRGKPWTPVTLKEFGGTEGVGVSFLEETFSASTAPPEHRYHQKAARAVLKSLLPDSGTDIKGHMRSHAELLQASGYGNRPKDFDHLIRILDSEIRLITPTDPEGQDADDESIVQTESGQKYYQLTHDYLVPSLRDWLTRKQKETRRGLAELLLADQTAMWNAKPENRFLPSLLQWLRIRCLTPKKNWSSPQRKMMSKAGRYHVLRGILVALLLVLIGWGVFEANGRIQAHALRDRLLDANTADVPAIVQEMAPYRRWVDPLLRNAYEEAEANKEPRQQLHASLALLPEDSGQVEYLYGRLLDAQPHEVPVIRDALASHKDQLLNKLWTVVDSPDKGKESQRLRAAAALAKYDPESGKWTKAEKAVGNDLVGVPAVYLSLWMNSLRDVRTKLFPQLSAVYRDANRREVERSLATDILADYAAADTELLADLLMDADEKQFSIIYPKLKERGEQGLTILTGEIDKQVVVPKDKIVYESKGVIADDDPKVKGKMPSKRFEYKLEADKKYRITLTSKEIDTFLVLQDKAGKELAFDDDGGVNLNSMLVYKPLSDDTFTVFAASFQGTGSFHLKIVEIVFNEDAKEKLAKRQANAAVALLKMDRPEKVWALLKHSPDPTVRSYLLHRFAPLGVDAGAIIKRLEEEPDITIRRALVLSLGAYDEKEFPWEDRNALLPKLQEMYRKEADPGVHAASEWLLRTWKQEAWLKQMNREWTKDKEGREKKIEEIKDLVWRDKGKTPPQWYVNGQGQTMVVIPGPAEFVMGSPLTEEERRDNEVQHKRRIGRTFAIAAKSVTVAEYRRFNPKYTFTEKYAPEPNCPAVTTNWYQAAAYCNWLSKEEGILQDQWCYETDTKGQVSRLKANYLSLTGYRLPTEAEREYATRADSVTSRYYGETDELLDKYAWYSLNSKTRSWPVGLKKPNDWGLFDMHGNVWNWCQEAYTSNYPRPGNEGVLEDQEHGLVIVSTESRVLRGGSFLNPASFVRSANRNTGVPTFRFNNIGFRPSRTLLLDSFTALPLTPEGDRN